MALNWMSGLVLEKKIWTEGLFTLSIDVEGVAPFEPGQFLQVGMQHGEKHIHRPYSVASPHGRILEFYIVLVEEGELTPHLWKMDRGSQIDVSERAAGSFTLDKCPESKHLWLIGTGTGLAPYIAMLRTAKPWERYEQIVVVHGVRHLPDLSYSEELKQFEAEYPGRFHYVPTATRESGDGVLRGRIPQLIESGDLESFADVGMTADTSCVMLCGNPAMLDDMEELLAKREMKKHRTKSPGHIVLERYW